MSSTRQLREQVCTANRRLGASGLTTLTWGNASARDAALGVMAIKPSGVPYELLSPDDVVVLDMAGRVVEGRLRPSVDAATHLALYAAWPVVHAVVHAHSTFATAFAQARRSIPCLGTTHADHFAGEIPVTRQLSEREVETDYEGATGRVIVERFSSINPAAVPAVLVAGHAPFTWGPDAARAMDNAIALEAVAKMAHAVMALNGVTPLEGHLLRHHHQRKHGPGATYGQK